MWSASDVQNTFQLILIREDDGKTDNRSWPFTFKFQINAEKVVETTIAKASEVESQS
jgi:hypothetical protein